MNDSQSAGKQVCSVCGAHCYASNCPRAGALALPPSAAPGISRTHAMEMRHQTDWNKVYPDRDAATLAARHCDEVRRLAYSLENELAEANAEILRIHNDKVDHFEARIKAERELAQPSASAAPNYEQIEALIVEVVRRCGVKAGIPPEIYGAMNHGIREIISLASGRTERGAT